MTDLDPAVLSQFQERRGVHGKVLIWIGARNRVTNATEYLGFWSGDDHRDFDIGGETRTYYGAGNVIGVDPIRTKAGLDVIYHTITLPPFTDELRLALMQYDPRLAPTQVHGVALNIDTQEPLAPPFRAIKGTLQDAPSTLGAKGSRNSFVKLKVASSTRRLTQGLPIYRSDQAQQDAFPGDKGRQHVGVAGDWPVAWGED